MVRAEHHFGLVPCGVGAAQQRVDAGLQLGRAQRLGHEIVGTDIEALDQVGVVVALGHEQDGHPALVVLADRPHDVGALHVGQAPVEHQHVEGLAAHRMEQGLATRIGVALVAEARHGLVDQLKLVRLSVEYCNSHSIPFSALSRSVYVSAI
ncbi:hypothetical protein D9M68_775030 [compost metagenome]